MERVPAVEVRFSGVCQRAVPVVRHHAGGGLCKPNDGKRVPVHIRVVGQHVYYRETVLIGGREIILGSGRLIDIFDGNRLRGDSAHPHRGQGVVGRLGNLDGNDQHKGQGLIEN